MEELLKSHSYVCVKAKHIRHLQEKIETIREVFRVRLREVTTTEDVSNRLGFASKVTFFLVEPDDPRISMQLGDTACKVQNYVDMLCSSERDDRGDDSSYDSDVEAEGDLELDPDGDPDISGRSHHGVSRTSSDTLAAEYAEYVSQPPPSPPQPDAGYTTRLEFGLKLGYTERLVQAALHKLGPNPAQNELLAELVKLGANAARTPDVAEDVCAGLCAAPGLGVGDDAPPAPPPPPAPPHEDDTGSPRLRPIVIDGSNVAMSHGNKEVFSCRGIKICVDWFRLRGHKDITVFVPKWRKESSRPDNLVTEQDILHELERDRLLVFTPSRHVGGKRMVCYDDRYILRLAADTDGVVVSNDNYRDLAQESPDYRRVVEERVLMFSFVNDRFMPPDDPLGRSGPTLEQFLRLQPRRGDPPPPCPYAKKCTYGNKCKFDHPERGALPHKSVTERLVEQAQRQLQAAGLQGRSASRDSSPGKQLQLKGKSLSLPLPDNDAAARPFRSKAPLSRTRSTAAAPDTEANHHRKLQRQLTLNPTCDPRLPQMRRLVGSPTSPVAPSSSVTSVSPSSPPAHPPLMSHPPLSRHSSTEVPPVAAFSRPPPGSGHLDHAHVMRIASAPDSYRNWPPPEHRLGASEPQLHMTATGPAASGLDQAWCRPLPMMAPPSSAAGWPSTSLAEARRRLRFHLSYIFPEEQVCAAMQLYPEESDPQKICAAILAMYPKP